MPDFFDNTLYMDVCKARATAFSALTLMTVKIEGIDRMPMSAEKSTSIISLQLSIEHSTFAIMKMDLTADEKKQELLEVQVLKQTGLLADERFAAYD